MEAIQTERTKNAANGQGMTAAQRKARQRLRQTACGLETVTITLSAELVSALDKFLLYKDLTKAEVIEAALRDRFMRKR